MEKDKKKILLVDDEEQSLFFLSKTLSRHGYDVITASKGKDAVFFAKSNQPDVIVLDIAMPDMDGGDVAQALDDNPATQNIPIIFLTALMTKEEESLKSAGKRVVQMLSKPANEEDLISALNKALPL